MTAIVDIAARGEFELHAGKALGRLGAHFLEPFDRGEFGLHRFEQQPFGIGGRIRNRSEQR